jgi:hypothetical protein
MTAQGSAARAGRTSAPFVSSVLHAVTWHTLGVSQLIGFAIGAVRYLEQRGVDVTEMGYLEARITEAPQHFPDAHFVVAPIAAFCILIAALAADEAMRRGARLGSAMLAAIPLASVTAALLQYLVRLALGSHYAPSGVRPLLGLAAVTADTAMLGTLAALAFLKHGTEQRMLREVRRSELERVELDQRRLDYGLMSSRAQVPPAWLAAEIAAVRDLYATHGPAAEGRLEALIEELRRRVRNATAIARGGSLR